MGVWKERAYLASSIFFCTLAVVLGTLLYPLVLLFFGVIALIHPILRRGSASRGTPRGAVGA
jgi:Flp pilus assembly protein TadB